MNNTHTPRKTEQGWVVDIPAEIVASLGVEEGSLAALNVRDGGLQIEILPPLSAELKELSRRVFERNRKTFAELKRLGE